MSFNIHMNEVEEMFFDAYKSMYNNNLPISINKEFNMGKVSLCPLHDTLFGDQYYYFKEDTQLTGKLDIAYYFLVITVEGDNYLEVERDKNSYGFCTNKIYLGFSQGSGKYKININKKCKTRQYSFSFTKDILIAYLKEFDNLSLIKQIEEAQKFDIFNAINLSPTHQYLIEKMMKNPYHGALKKLYFETCASELLLTLLKDISCKKVYNLVLDDKDKEQLQIAKEILLQDIQNPPTIDQLSKMVSINQDKLKKGFKSLFGNTIFKTLTQERMKIAYSQMQKDDMSVGEVAYDAGYENVSNFISVFKREFGKTPGEMRKERNYYYPN